MTHDSVLRLDLADVRWSDSPETIIAQLLAQTDGAVEIDGSRAGAISAHTVQILISARLAAKAREIPFVVNAPSDAARDSLALLGIDPEVLGVAA